jgi:predicted RNase H-like HicB family nuclease
MTLADKHDYWREQWDSLVDIVRRPMLNTYTIHMIVEEVGGEIRYSAAVKEMPECFTEALDLQSLFTNLYEAMSTWIAAQQEGEDNEQMDTQKEQKRNIFEADYPNLEDG